MIICSAALYPVDSLLYSCVSNKFVSAGRGIFTLAVFNQGDFVVEYRGELIDAAESEHRRKVYHNAGSIFMFDFIWKWKTWWYVQNDKYVLISIV